MAGAGAPGRGLLHCARRASRSPWSARGSQRARRARHGGGGGCARAACRVPVCIARSRRDRGAWMRGRGAGSSGLQALGKSSTFQGPRRRRPALVPKRARDGGRCRGAPGTDTRHQTPDARHHGRARVAVQRLVAHRRGPRTPACSWRRRLRSLGWCCRCRCPRPCQRRRLLC
jgi:hypothetical protein